MFVLEKLEKVGVNDEKWVMYAQHYTASLLENMIKNKKNPELFRIVERNEKVVREKTERCLVFRVFDDCTAGRIEGKLMDHGIRFVSRSIDNYILFNVMRSGWKWQQVIELVASVSYVKHYFTKIDMENLMVCT